jgi:hypothetical protein
VTDLEELRTDVLENGWDDTYRKKLRQLLSSSGVKESDPDSEYDRILEEYTR